MADENNQQNNALAEDKPSLKEAVDALLDPKDELMLLIITMVANGEMQDLLDYLMQVNRSEFIDMFKESLDAMPAEQRTADLQQLMVELERIAPKEQQQERALGQKDELVAEILEAMKSAGIAGGREATHAKAGPHRNAEHAASNGMGHELGV